MECERHVERALELSSQLLELTNEERGDCDHDGCLLLDGIVRDCALQIKNVALRWSLDLGHTAMRRGLIDAMKQDVINRPAFEDSNRQPATTDLNKEESP